MMRKIAIVLMILVVAVMGYALVRYPSLKASGMATYNSKDCPADRECTVYGLPEDCNADPCRFGCYYSGSCQKCNEDFSCGDVKDQATCENNPCDKSCMWLDSRCVVAYEGTYYVKPSFTAEIAYNINDYDEISAIADEVASSCAAEEDIVSCYKKIGMGHSSYTFDTDCAVENEVLYAVSEQYLKCAQSYDTQCVCTVTIPDTDEYAITIKKQDETTVFSFQGAADAEWDTSPRVTVPFVVNYWLSSNGVSITQDMILTIEDEEGELKVDRENGESWDLDEKYYMLKSFNSGKHITSFIPESMYKSTYSQYPKCSINEQRVVKACITKQEQGKQAPSKDTYSAGLIPQYNSESDKIEFVPVVYKLGIEIEDKVAPKAVDFNLHHDADAEDKVIVEWDKSTSGDTAGYEVYYSKESFSQISDSLHKIDVNLKDNKLDDQQLTIVNSRITALGSFAFDKDKKQYMYSSNKQLIDSNKLYHFYSSTSNFYAMQVNNLDTGSYYFTVIPYDASGNKQDATITTEKVTVARGFIS